MEGSTGYRIVFIIGAPRCGTNMLRDVLASLPGFATWPCDEINSIWRYRNARKSTDELRPVEATPSIKTYIRQQFDLLARKTKADFIVEKTCANCLRLDFVKSIFPEANYIWIQRNGRDAVVSAMKRWKAGFELAYTLKKLRFVPFRDLPVYLYIYAVNRLRKTLMRSERLGFWGPTASSLETLRDKGSLPEICSAQWVACTGSALRSFEEWGFSGVHSVKYEEFVIDPVSELSRILEFLGVGRDPRALHRVVTRVSTDSVGRHARDADKETLGVIDGIIGSLQKRIGYIVN